MDYIGKLGGKKTVERRAVLIALAVLTFVFQNTGGLFPSPFGIKAILLIPLTICIAMFEREFAGIFFGLLSGVMIDSFSSQSVVFNSLFFTVIGFTAGALITYLMRNNLLCATIMTAVASVFYSTLSFVVYSAFDPIENHFIFFLRYYLSSAIFTVLMTPVYYIIVRAIFKEFKEN